MNFSARNVREDRMKIKTESWQQELIRIRQTSRPTSMQEKQSMLQLKNVRFNYSGQQYFEGIRNVNLKLSEGKILAITGKSGSGKTTLLKCIYGLYDLTGGEVLMNGEQVTGPSFNLMPGHREMELVSQEYYVLMNHTVQENFFDKLQDLTYGDRQKRADKLLKLLELEPLRNIRARDLSSGQKQRVAIGRALAVFPRLLLLDEPFSNIDNLLSEKLFAFIISEAKKCNTAVILITHLPEEALKYADSLAVMDKGRILQEGETWDVYYRPKNSRLAGLLGDFNVLKKEDLESGGKHRSGKKIYIRPDMIKAAGPGKKADIVLSVTGCSYNGKCFEVLAETKNGRTVKVYSPKALQPGAKYSFLLGSLSQKG
jgi:ABC-type glutathione transport system ATPase component